MESLVNKRSNYWLSAATDEVIPCTVAGGVFLAITPEGGGASCGGLFSLDFIEAHQKRLLEEGVAKCGGGGSSYTVKVLGSKGDVARVQLGLGAVPWKIVPVILKGPTEIFFYPSSGRIRVMSAELSTPQNAAKAVIRVGIVDDSKTIRLLLRRILSADSSLVIAWEAANGAEALANIRQDPPDVITLDIHMPGMNGVEVLKAYLPTQRIPTILVTSLSQDESPLVFEALSFGAVDYLQKPHAAQLTEIAQGIIDRVRVAATARVVAPERSPVRNPALRATGALNPSALVVIGASTGGTEALKKILVELPAAIPPILIVQHIPPVFSKAFAEHLDKLCAFEVAEAKDGDEVRPGRALVAPGGLQMRHVWEGSRQVVRLGADELVSGHRPSVDVLFDSVAQRTTRNVMAIILTGMGTDGAKGMLKLKNAGAHTVAQDEASCVVYGMPREAVKLGGIDKVLPLKSIAAHMLEHLVLREEKLRMERI